MLLCWLAARRELEVNLGTECTMKCLRLGNFCKVITTFQLYNWVKILSITVIIANTGYPRLHQFQMH